MMTMPSVPSEAGDAEPEVRSLAPAVKRAGSILALLESAPQRPFALSDIARALGLPKSTTLNICTALQQINLLRRSHEGYQLGRRLLQLGSAYTTSVDIIREFYEVCRQAPADLNAIVQLSVLDEQLMAIYLARQDCNSGLRLGLQAEIGRRVPANCSASGKALLAALPRGEFAARVAGLERLDTLTDQSIGTISALRAALDEINAAGFSADDEEVIPGLVCQAVALSTSHREDGLVAVSISAQKHTVTDERRAMIHETLLSIRRRMQDRI